MSSLTQSSGNAEVVRRIAALRADARPQWGKLTCPQMLAHCQKPFAVAAGELKLKRGIIGLLFGKIAKKKFVVGSAPFKRNSPTDPRFLVRDANDFAREQARLTEQVERFGETGPLTRDSHPFFGPMTAEEWDGLLWKHLDHHLRQFGV